MTLTPNSPPGQQPNKWMIINTVVLIVINLYLAFVIGTAEAKFGGDLIGLFVFVYNKIG